MCFRLYAAVQGGDGAELTRLAFARGLDVRVAARGPTHFVEVAWGDCACSLYTKREGRQRVVNLVEDLGARRLRVQLLLARDDGELEASGPAATVTWQTFREEALAALPEGRAAQVVF